MVFRVLLEHQFCCPMVFNFMFIHYYGYAYELTPGHLSQIHDNNSVLGVPYSDDRSQYFHDHNFHKDEQHHESQYKVYRIYDEDENATTTSADDASSSHIHCNEQLHPCHYSCKNTVCGDIVAD